jgi:CheY-like chemotaxis protein
MNQHTVLLLDDVAADRQLAARVLRGRGWIVHGARTTEEADALLAQLAASPRPLIVTDLHMPADPAHRSGDRAIVAGAQWALRVRAQMERNVLTRVPIVALTALTEHEIHLTALAFGCDAVVPKPITPALGDQIERALTHMGDDGDPVGAAALLRLLRHRLADALQPPPARAPITEQDVTRALLAYHRRGLVGLGDSTLAAALAPHITSTLRRGEHTYAVLVAQLAAVMRLGAHESIAILQGELIEHTSPTDQSAALGVSLSEYYRRRREAIVVLVELLTNKEQ